MKSTRLLPLAAAAASFAASAEAAGPLPAVTDPNAPVAPLQYQSVFAADAPQETTQPSPDKVWIRANRDLTGAATEDQHAGHGEMGKPAAPAPAAAPRGVPDARPATGRHQGQHRPMKEH